MNDRIEAWMRRLQFVSQHPEVRAERAAECVLLGHEPSGEYFATNTPIHVCWWCLAEFRRPEKTQNG